ncbi:hypothetical protein [uncultured Nitratireductor sp.]|uniref:hypothetical protein n=1 Tax=uncultured Nitratireductor sp. TaxID=520953 RepID=UPI0025F34A09|nr:hypothetical protein [uncultured Nitratireductor sp.]
MRHSDNARLVSGEIMMPDGKDGAPRRGAVSHDAIDVEFETIGPAEEADAGPCSAFLGGGAVSGLDLLKPGGRTQGKKPARAGPLFWVFGVTLIAGAFWVSGGHSLVGATDRHARDTPFQILRLVDVTSRVERQGSNAVLVVDGTALNSGGKSVALPSISINVLTENGSTTRYFLGTTGQHLGPGARFPFSSRLVAPREGVKSVSVTFRSS